MQFYSGERIALFIDGSNLYSAARALDFDIDYKNLLKVFGEHGQLVRAFYYTALVDDQEYSPIRPLIDWLDYNGYTMVTKPTKEFTDSSGRRKVKASMDIELAIDIMELADNIDHIVLFSGDGNFRRVVEAVQKKGVRVSVVSTVCSNPPMIADELRRQADIFIELKEISNLIARKDNSGQIMSASHQPNFLSNPTYEEQPDVPDSVFDEVDADDEADGNSKKKSHKKHDESSSKKAAHSY